MQGHKKRRSVVTYRCSERSRDLGACGFYDCLGGDDFSRGLRSSSADSGINRDGCVVGTCVGKVPLRGGPPGPPGGPVSASEFTKPPFSAMKTVGETP